MSARPAFGGTARTSPTSRARGASRRTRRPVLSPLVLPGLESGEGDSLESHGSVEGLAVDGVDLSGRDLSGVSLSECELRRVSAHETRLTSARLLECRIDHVDAPVLHAERSTWRDVEVTGSRIGALDAYDADVRQTRITGCKLDWINLRSASLEDVLLEDCTIQELDLSGVTAARVAFVNCRADSVSLAHAKLSDVDLRGLAIGTISNLEGMSGATLDAHQVTALAPAFASHLGIRVED